MPGSGPHEEDPQEREDRRDDPYGILAHHLGLRTPLRRSESAEDPDFGPRPHCDICGLPIVRDDSPEGPYWRHLELGSHADPHRAVECTRDHAGLLLELTGRRLGAGPDRPKRGDYELRDQDQAAAPDCAEQDQQKDSE